MRKHGNRMSAGSLLRISRFQVIGILAVVIVFAAAAMAVSMQAGKAENSKGEDRSQRAGNYSRVNSTALRSAQEGHPFGQTVTHAQIRPLTQEEAQQLAEGIRDLVNQSTEGLKQVHHADGSVSMDLEGRFQNVALAKKTADGNVAQSCVDNRESAAAFLGLDRQLIEGTKQVSPSKSRGPVSELPAKGQNQ